MIQEGFGDEWINERRLGKVSDAWDDGFVRSSRSWAMRGKRTNDSQKGPARRMQVDGTKEEKHAGQLVEEEEEERGRGDERRSEEGREQRGRGRRRTSMSRDADAGYEGVVPAKRRREGPGQPRRR